MFGNWVTCVKLEVNNNKNPHNRNLKQQIFYSPECHYNTCILIPLGKIIMYNFVHKVKILNNKFIK